MSTSAEDEIQAARPHLEEAVRLDKSGNANDALQKYMQGISGLMTALNLLDNSDNRREKLRQQIHEYMSRAESLKSKTKIEVKSIERREIVADSTGHSYGRVFAKCIDDELEWVTVQDAYIIAFHQMMNFVRFCELLVASKRLRQIELTTGKGAKKNEGGFAELAASLQARGVQLNIKYSDSIHDREIRFSNGWIVKIGRGLDYFKNPGKYAIGACDMDLRKCHQTTIDIFRMTRLTKQ